MMKKEGDGFSSWFDYVLREAEVYDYGRYPVKGMGIWLPYGFAIRKNVLELLRRLLDDSGHEEILLPILIPEYLLYKEAEHIRGFSDQVYWVTHGGNDPLEIKYALRPTSETSLTFMESLWLSSYKELPKKYYQIVNIFRYETKATRPLIRLREVTTFKEAHTADESFENAERTIYEAIEIYSRFFTELGIPFLISKRPDWDKFAGALYTIAFDTLMPDGKVLQIGTVHLLGQSFSKALDAKIQLKNEEIDYIWQTSYGLSDRVIASLIAVHGDDRGLVLPFKVAPIQVIIIPIPSKDKETDSMVKEYARKLRETLSSCGLRAKIDERAEYTPGWKYHYWELKGVPLRAEVGLREAEKGTVTIARRDTGERSAYKLDEVCQAIFSIGKNIDERLAVNAMKSFREKIRRVNSVDDAKETLLKNKGIVELPWCGRDKCGMMLEDMIDARFLGTPLESVHTAGDEICPVCGTPAVTVARLGKTY